MQASTPQRSPRSRRLIGIGAAALLAVPATLISAAPAHAAEPGSATFTSSTATEWIVPAGVREVAVTALGGSGGNAWVEHGGAGGLGASVESVLTVEPGEVLTVWAGAAGGNAGDGPTESGAGGAGYVAGGTGATSGSAARPGAGGGGASAVSVDGAAVVIAGGGGGGGGRGVNEINVEGLIIPACSGGGGGNAGAAGAASYSTNPLCSTQQGGVAGGNPAVAGSNAANVPVGTILDAFRNADLGGSGGGGAGAGGAGSLGDSGIIRTAGGGGGGGGASLGDVVGVAAAAGNGSVVLDWEVAYTTTLEINPSPIPAQIGEDISFTAVVENTETDESPVGEIAFDFDGTIVTAPLVSTGIANIATATIDFPAGALGTLTVDATYTPTDGSPFAPATGSSTYEVERGNSLLVLDVEPVDPAYFHVVRATATVSVVEPAVSTLDGNVVFYHGEELIDIVPVDPETGQAWVEFTAVEIGESEVFAAYTDDSFLNPSDDVTTYTAHAAATTTKLKASAKEVAHGGKVKFEAHVTSSVAPPVEPVEGSELPQTGDVSAAAVAALDTPVSPAGVVRFVAGDKVLAEVALSANGTAAFETAALPTGSHEVVAHFVSSVPELASSKSEAVKVTVAAAKHALASTGVDAGLLGGGALLALLLLGAGAVMVIRRRATA